MSSNPVGGYGGPDWEGYQPSSTQASFQSDKVVPSSETTENQGLLARIKALKLTIFKKWGYTKIPKQGSSPLLTKTGTSSSLSSYGSLSKTDPTSAVSVDSTNKPNLI